MTLMKFETLSDTGAELGESPVWWAEDRSIWWVDIGGKRLLQTFVDDGKTNIWPTPEEIGFVVLTDQGRVLVGMERGLFWFDQKSGTFDLCAEHGQSDVRFNDATVDSSGRLWAGTMDLENTRPVGVLYLVGPDLSLTPVIDGLLTVNGLAMDENLNRLYLSDSHPSVQTIWHMQVGADGSLSERKLFVDMHDHTGRPDGGAVDSEGNYWIAGVGGGVLHVFAPAGSHLAEYETPYEAPTKPMFGGANLDQLYLTSKGDSETNGALAIALDTQKLRGQIVPPFIVDPSA